VSNNLIHANRKQERVSPISSKLQTCPSSSAMSNIEQGISNVEVQKCSRRAAACMVRGAFFAIA
jgi:hypothetical protein